MVPPVIGAVGLAEKVKSPSCHPGFSATNLQITTQKGAGMKEGAGFQKGGHSCADGSLPLVMAVAHPQGEGGAYYGPHETRTG